jgi:hypothetical protein
MKRLILASAVAASAVMVWAIVFWAGGGADAGFSHLDSPTELALRELMDQEFPESGTYAIPQLEGGTVEDWTTHHLAGPLAFVMVTKAGTDPASPRVYLMGFLHMMLTALLLGLLMTRALPTSLSYGRKIGFAVLTGVLVAFWSNLSDPIWFYQPWAYHLVTTVYDIIAFAIMGAILGRFLKE